MSATQKTLNWGWVLGIIASVIAALLVGRWTQAGVDHDAVIRLESNYESHLARDDEKHAALIRRLEGIEAAASQALDSARTAAGLAREATELTRENNELLKKVEKRTR